MTKTTTKSNVASNPSNASNPKGNQQAVITLMRRKEGADLPELIAATGWLPHSARAALSGLRKRGFVLEKSKAGGVTRYKIASEPSA